MNKFMLSIFEDSSTIVVPGVYDSITTKLVESFQFKAAWVSGFSVMSSLFIPDNNSISINKYVERISEIRNVSILPLIIDCDEGFGDIKNTIQLFNLLSQLNIECCCVEDNEYPKVNSFRESGAINRKIKSKEHFAHNISVLKNMFPQICFIARTESLIVGEDIGQAIERAHFYKKAGADLIIIHSKSKTFQDFEHIITRYGDPKSLAVIPTIAENMTYKDFELLKYRVVIYANQILRRNLTSTIKTLKLLKDNPNISNINKDAVSMDFIFDFVENPNKPMV